MTKKNEGNIFLSWQILSSNALLCSGTEDLRLNLKEVNYNLCPITTHSYAHTHTARCTLVLNVRISFVWQERIYEFARERESEETESELKSKSGVAYM